MIVHKELLIPSVIVKRTPPLNLITEAEIYFQHEYEKILSDVYLWEMKNVNISADGIIFKGLNIYSQNLISQQHRKDINLKYILKKYSRNKKIVLDKNETYLLVHHYWSMGYFHWMCDVLQRLVAIRQLLPFCTLLIPDNYSLPFMSESLELFFFKRIQIFPVNSYVNVASLIIPDHIAVTGNYNIEIMTTLRKLFLSHYKDRSYSFGEKIFVSRKKATIRYIFNEEEVENELNLHGFKTVYFEDHNLEQQIAIMQNARYLIGITGANMVNMMFMPVGSSVILFNKSQNKNDNCYFSLANVFFHKFIYQFCHDQASHESDWKLIVDINKLKENLKLMLGS